VSNYDEKYGMECVTAMGFANVLTNKDVTLSVRDMVGYWEGVAKNRVRVCECVRLIAGYTYSRSAREASDRRGELYRR
jgi:hypothetical protein